MATRVRIALGTLATIWHLSAPAQAPQPELPTVRLQAGMHLIEAEVARDERARMRGLMQRTTLKPNHGMLFIFDSAEHHCFWMRNTPLPLSIAFIDDQGRITHLADMAPLTDTSHCPPGPIRFALEMTQGWFKQRGLTVGSQLKHPVLFMQPAPSH